MGKDAAGQPFVAGVYPLLQDEMCWFLAIDFDKANWQDDATAFLETCAQVQVNAALERSRSGRGGHAWLFSEEAVPAALARRLGSHLLTDTMERRPDLGFDSYDRLFPSQDTLPHGGFGNLIALPLQKAARDKGGSVFVDDRLVPWTDQWAFLSGLRRIDRLQVRVRLPLFETPFDLRPEPIEPRHQIQRKRRARQISAETRHRLVAAGDGHDAEADAPAPTLELDVEGQTMPAGSREQQ